MDTAPIRKGLFRVDYDYVRFLKQNDKQVWFDENKPREDEETRPYFGFIDNITGFAYCIPLMSMSKNKAALNWDLVSDYHITIYSKSYENYRNRYDVREIEPGKFIQLIAVLFLDKMIPVDENLCTRIDFSSNSTEKDVWLLRKEYNFLVTTFGANKIQTMVKDIYDYQKLTNVICNNYCTFNILETAYNSFKNNQKIGLKDTDNNMLDRKQFATAAEGRWKTVKYATTDCQAFIEVCAKDAGYTFNSRGSNDIWRNYLTSKGDSASYPLAIGDIVFKHRAESSKLPARYQGDGLGDFYHVGIVTDKFAVCHSANSKENGKRDVFSSQAELAKVWTHAGTLKNTSTTADTISSTIGTVDKVAAIEKLEEVISLLKS